MELKRQTRSSFKLMSRIGISPRLILALTLYTTISLFFVIALLYAPIVVVLGSILAGLVVDSIRWINRHSGHTEGVL